MSAIESSFVSKLSRESDIDMCVDKKCEGILC